MVINRAIVATDANPLYYEFWPIVARAWSNIGIAPVVAAIGDVNLNYAYGNIIKFPLIDNIPSGFIAQVIRFIIPCFYPEEVSIIGDIDMLPLSKAYFTKTVADYDDDKIIVFSGDAYKDEIRYPMCYIAAKGKYFQQIIGINDLRYETIVDFIKNLHSLNLNWDTDELFFARAFQKSPLFSNAVLLKRGGWHPSASRRIDRINWRYNNLKLICDYYIDAHCPRPLHQEHAKIKALSNYIYSLSDGKRYLLFLLRKLAGDIRKHISTNRQQCAGEDFLEIEQRININTTKDHPIISFSLYGNNSRYTKNIDTIILLYKTLLPDWKCRFYIASDVSSSIVESIAEHGCDILIMKAKDVDHRYSLWRFLANEDASVAIFRDLDSLPTQRELQMIKQWMISDKALHIIRDHPYHSAPIMAGMWGIKDIKLNLRQQIKDASITDFYGVDQLFLERYYKTELANALIHDSFPRFPNENPIVIPYQSKEHYIGHVISEDVPQYEDAFNFYHNRCISIT